ANTGVSADASTTYSLSRRALARPGGETSVVGTNEETRSPSFGKEPAIMFEAAWSFARFTMAAVPLFCLAATGILAWMTLRRLWITRAQIEKQFDDLARRLQISESRIDRAASPAAPAGSKWPKTDGQGIPGLALSGHGELRHQDSSDRGET